MITLRLSSNKELSCTATTSIYSNENSFDTIRVIASPLIDGKNIEDFKVELYIYNILNREWNTFNDCVPCKFALKDNKYVFETPVKSQYTVYPCLGMYCKIIGENGVVGKTNVVNIPVLYHRDNNIDVSQSIEVFEKYKKDMLKDASDILYDSNFIYFKKECENWDAPRIYFFNKDYSEGQIEGESWGFSDSPYMFQNEEGYYYYPRIKGYDNVIFFCDKLDGGWNYKTSDLTLPSSSWYQAPLFVQSEIGYDGFWADYNTKSTKLLVQLNWSDNSYKDSNISVEYVDANEIRVTPKFYDFGMVTNGGHDGNTNYRSPYRYIELPIDFKELTIVFDSINSVKYSKAYNTKRNEICYEYPVVYNEDLFDNSNSVGTLKYFNAYVDEKLRYKLENHDRELLRRIEAIEILCEQLKSQDHEEGILSRFTSNSREGTCWIANLSYIKDVNFVTLYGTVTLSVTPNTLWYTTSSLNSGDTRYNSCNISNYLPFVSVNQITIKVPSTTSIFNFLQVTSNGTSLYLKYCRDNLNDVNYSTSYNFPIIMSYMI